MKFHHMCIIVSDMDRAISMWCDVLGFSVAARATLPDDPADPAGPMAPPALLDAIFGAADARSEWAMVVHPDGARIELHETQNPKVVRSPASDLGYDRTGIRELGLEVRDIDGWYDRILDAGLDPQTDHVWATRGGRSFLFFDHDRNLIQFFERAV